jgi:hypothetical protein
MQDLLGMLVEALDGDVVSRAALRDVLVESGYDRQSRRLQRLLELIYEVRQMRARANEDLDVLIRDDLHDSESEAAIMERIDVCDQVISLIEDEQ